MRRAIAATASLLAFAATGIAAPAAQAADPTTTDITFAVTGCNGCVITPVWAIEGQGVVTFASTTVVDGSAMATVPVASTSGMSFNITAPWKVDIDAEPVIVTQYQGRAEGSRVTMSQAKASAKATACWSGTTAASVTLRVTVRRVQLPGLMTSGTVKVPLAWMRPTVGTTGGFAKAQKGVIAQQEAWYCPAG
jgi:hypothetical protein